MQIDTKPPVGDADGVAAGGFGAIGKLIFMNMVQNWFAGKKISKLAKLLIFIAFFIGNLSYNTKSFLQGRQPTLYDHLNISRVASFEEIKKAKDHYL